MRARSIFAREWWRIFLPLRQPFSEVLDKKFYRLRLICYIVNLLFGVIVTRHSLVESLLLSVIVSTALLSTRVVRTRFHQKISYPAMVIIDFVLITWAIYYSGGFASDSYLYYLFEIIFLTMYLGGFIGVLTAVFAMGLYSFVISRFGPVVTPWDLMYRMTAFLILSVGVGYIGYQLRCQLMRNERMARENWRLAHTDSLTGLHNARVLFDELSPILEGFSRHGTPFSILMFDADSLKNVNDTFGHEMGDKLILHLAEVGRRVFLPEGHVIRYAGDEFFVLFADVAAELVHGLADSFVIEVEKDVEAHIGLALKVTASIGIASFASPERGPFTQAEVLRLADQALYESKGGGKARVTHYRL